MQKICEKICIYKNKVVPLHQFFKNKPIKGGGNTIKNGNKIMTANIEVSVKVYLYQQLENSARNNYCGELINYCEVYPTWEQAERCLKVIENREAEDGVPFETAIGTIYQYHLNYKNEAGEQVWEIRHERFNKEGRLEYNSCKVIEKQF